MVHTGWLRNQLAQCPLAAPAIAVIAAVLFADHASAWPVFLFIGAIALSLLGRKYVWLLSVLLALFAGALHLARVSEQAKVSEHYGDWWSGVAVVTQSPQYGNMHVKVRSEPLNGHTVQVLNSNENLRVFVGDVVQLDGRLLEPKKSLNPEVFNQREWLNRNGIRSVLVAQNLNETGDVDGLYYLSRWAELSRVWLSDRLVMGISHKTDAVKIIRAMTLGLRPVASDELLDDFRDSGAIHVFAVSGLHVMMVGSMVAVMLRVFGCPRRYWIPCVILAMFFYAMVTGMRPPAMRASVMGAVLLGAWLVRRQIVLANSVALGIVLILIWDGHMLFLPGFQLSFGVLVAIALLGALFSKMLSWISYVDEFLPRSLYSHRQEWSLKLRRKVQSGAVVASCAWCGAAPLTLFYFRQLAPISILVSLPMVFLLYLIIMTSCAALLLGGIWSPITVGLNQVNAQLAGIARGLAAKSADVPGGHFKAEPWCEGERLVVYAMPDGGAAVYIGIAGGMMLDVGGERSFKREVLPSLTKRGARVDSVLLSHADSQHCGGIEGLLSEFKVRQAVVPEMTAVSSVYKKALMQLQGTGCAIKMVEVGDELKLSENARVDIISVPESTFGLADDRELVARLHWRGIKVLFLNDVGYQFERSVSEKLLDVSADIVVLGKHQRDLPVSSELIQKIAPNLVITSEVQPPETISKKGMPKFYALLDQGALSIEWDGEFLQVNEGEAEVYLFDGKN